MGWGTQPLRIQLRLLTFQFSCLPYPGGTCRPFGALVYLVYAVFYKHAAPLGLNAAELAARYPSWGRGFLAQRVGEPNPYGCSFGCSRSNFRVSCILVGHAAPLGLNAAEFAARYRLWGRGFLAQRVGEPNPYGCSFGCSRSNFRVSCILVGHAAPLGLNAAELAARYRSWGRGYLARWVGEPNPYGCSFGCSRSNFRASRILVGHAAPLGLKQTPVGRDSYLDADMSILENRPTTGLIQAISSASSASLR